MHNTVLMGKSTKESYLEELKVDGKVILKWLSDRQGDSYCSALRQMAGSCEFDNKPQGSKNVENLLTAR